MKGNGGKRSQQGAAAVEFALILPIFLLLLFGMIEYGWILTNQIVLTHAVSEGARAAVKVEEDEAETFAKQSVCEAFWIQDMGEDAVITEIHEDENLKRIEVRVPGIIYTPLTGFLPSTLIPKKLGAKAVMVFP